jgi:hypothetical protein
LLDLNERFEGCKVILHLRLDAFNEGVFIVISVALGFWVAQVRERENHELAARVLATNDPAFCPVSARVRAFP